MKVSGIFKTLIVVVACIIIGALVLNIFLPNVVVQLSTAVESSIYQATGMSFDFNGDGTKGGSNSDADYAKNHTTKGENATGNKGTGVDGFKSGGKTGGSGSGS